MMNDKKRAVARIRVILDEASKLAGWEKRDSNVIPLLNKTDRAAAQRVAGAFRDIDRREKARL